MKYLKSEIVWVSFNDLSSLMSELVKLADELGIDDIANTGYYTGFSLTSLEHDDMAGFWTMEFERKE